MAIELVSGMLKWMMMWMLCMSKELASGVYLYKRYRFGNYRQVQKLHVNCRQSSARRSQGHEQVHAIAQ